ncbi:Malignant T-cell-amplified sequence 1, partial [Lamprotornis superbus]
MKDLHRNRAVGVCVTSKVLLKLNKIALCAKVYLFDEKENVSNCIQLKTSVIKGIKNQLIDQFPVIEPWLNQIMPKKDPVKIVRCHEHIEILTVNGELLFFRQREGIFYPTLRLLHKYPFILPHQQVDKGAIKFVLSGANIMCPGLTSPGAKLYPAAVDTVVAIMAEGKQHALCVGVMKMSAEDIEKVNKGIGIENIHYLNDGLWHMKTYNNRAFPEDTSVIVGAWRGQEDQGITVRVAVGPEPVHPVHHHVHVVGGQPAEGDGHVGAAAVHHLLR